MNKKKRIPWNKGLKGEEYSKHFKNGFAKPQLNKKCTENQLRGLKLGIRKGWHHSDESNLKNSIKHRGSNNSMWKGGNNKWRGHDWKIIKERILKRDNYLCVKCKKKAQIVHHKIDWDLKKTYDDKLLESLCRSCHMKIHIKKIMRCKEWEKM